MAAPAAPTATTIASIAMYQAGYSTPTSAQKAHAKTYYIQEIKQDIFALAKNLTTLQFETVYALTEGQSTYTFPTDVSSLISATLLDGANYGTCSATGTTATIKLDAAFLPTEEWMLGKEILMWDSDTPAPLTAYISQCNAWSAPTATVSPIYGAAPDATDDYLVIDVQYPLEIPPVWDWDSQNYPTKQGRPTTLVPLGDETLSGEFLLYPAPNDDYYGLRLRYYLNLMTLDEAGTLHGNLYYRWRNIWIQGIKAKQLTHDDDNRAPAEIAKYERMLQILILREQYGMQLSELQVTCEDA